jgi:hypothetical protein
MSDYRSQDFDYRGPEDPFRRDAKLDPDIGTANAAWGWIAAAVFIVVILAVAFSVGRQPGALGTNTASNELTPPAATQMTPPANVPPTTNPTAATPVPPITTAPAPQGANQ